MPEKFPEELGFHDIETIDVKKMRMKRKDREFIKMKAAKPMWKIVPDTTVATCSIHLKSSASLAGFHKSPLSRASVKRSPGIKTTLPGASHC